MEQVELDIGLDNPHMPGVHLDQGKLRMDLIEPIMEEALAAVLTYGADKYVDYGWRTVNRGQERYYASLRRHLLAYREGEVLDQESGLPHSWHVLANAAILVSLESEECV